MLVSEAIQAAVDDATKDLRSQLQNSEQLQTGNLQKIDQLLRDKQNLENLIQFYQTTASPSTTKSDQYLQDGNKHKQPIITANDTPTRKRVKLSRELTEDDNVQLIAKPLGLYASNGFFKCLLPTRGASFRYINKDDLPLSIWQKSREQIEIYDSTSFVKGSYTWQTYAGADCSWVRLVTKGKCTFPQDDRACEDCIRNKRLCMIVKRDQGNPFAVLLPLPDALRWNIPPGEPEFWIERVT